MNARTFIAAAAAALGCAACGFKGPLYLPQQNAAVVTQPAPPSQVTPAAQAVPAKARNKKQQKPPTPPPSP